MTVYDDARNGKYNIIFDFATTPRDIYNAETNRLVSQLKADLEKEHGFVNHPKASKLFGLAWEHGHSAGYSEVAMYYAEFSELLS